MRAALQRIRKSKTQYKTPGLNPNKQDIRDPSNKKDDTTATTHQRRHRINNGALERDAPLPFNPYKRPRSPPRDKDQAPKGRRSKPNLEFTRSRATKKAIQRRTRGKRAGAHSTPSSASGRSLTVPTPHRLHPLILTLSHLLFPLLSHSQHVPFPAPAPGAPPTSPLYSYLFPVFPYPSYSLFPFTHHSQQGPQRYPSQPYGGGPSLSAANRDPGLIKEIVQEVVSQVIPSMPYLIKQEHFPPCSPPFRMLRPCMFISLY